MAKFKYKYGSIKNIKERLKTKAQREVYLVDTKINKVKQDIDNLRMKLSETKQDTLNSGNLKSSELQFITNYERFVYESISQKEEELVQLNKERNKKLEELAEKSKEVKIFNMLEEKEYENYLIEENRREQKEIDEIAAKKFVKEN